MRGILIPFYEIWGQSAIFYRRRRGIHKILSYDGPVGLSSIGPDDYVMSEAYFIDFLRFAQECGFDFVVAWDVPTYVDMPTGDSWRNTIHGVEQLRRVIKMGIPVSNTNTCTTSSSFMLWRGRASPSLWRGAGGSTPRTDRL